MHEYALTQRMVSIIERSAAEHAARAVSATLSIGENAGVLPECVQLYFDLLARGTRAEGAKLVFREQPARLYCEACGREYQKPRGSFLCPVCAGQGTPVDLATDCTVDCVELETQDDA